MTEHASRLRERTTGPRAVDPCTSWQPEPEQDAASARNDVDDQSARAERTTQSVAAEAAYQDWSAVAPSQRPLALRRAELAAAFDAAMHAHWIAGNGAYSNVAVARSCGVDEKTVRQWRDGAKPMPASALMLLPGALYEEIVVAIGAARGRTPRRAIVQLRDALRDLRGQLAHEDRGEVKRALREARSNLNALEDELE